METPITELINVITEEIDVSSPVEILDLLERCDQEIFNGYQDYKSLFHEDTIQTLEHISEHMKHALQDPENSIIVFGGCGTSGRLGYIVSRTFNELHSFDRTLQIFNYLIAGEDKALFTSQEAPEDDPHAGIEALKKVSDGKKLVIYIGISCGLSAPYVAGQIDYCLENLDTFVPVLMGFNPVHLARNINVEKWDKTFMQVVQRMESLQDKHSNIYILNPIVGPDPITGSSRMKSGTATKILLEAICMKTFSDIHHRNSNMSVRSYMECYRDVCTAVYEQKSCISKAVQIAGESLKAGGHIYYVGNDSLALIGHIDASECPPTYGSTLDDVRGFVKNGFATLKNTDGDMSHLGRHYRISLENFETDISLTEKDTVLMLNNESDPVYEHIKVKPCKKILLTFHKAFADMFDHVVAISLPISFIDERVGQENREIASQMFREVAVKWCLNAITTGAHIMIGKVFRNIMIDVKVSNNKLFHRAVGILQKLGQLSKDQATDYLLKSIYDTEELTNEIRCFTIAHHINTGTPKEKIVPAALVAAVSHSTIKEAKLALSKEPVIRTAIVNALKHLH